MDLGKDSGTWPKSGQAKIICQKQQGAIAPLFPFLAHTFSFMKLSSLLSFQALHQFTFVVYTVLISLEVAVCSVKSTFPRLICHVTQFESMRCVRLPGKLLIRDEDSTGALTLFFLFGVWTWCWRWGSRLLPMREEVCTKEGCVEGLKELRWLMTFGLPSFWLFITWEK